MKGSKSSKEAKVGFVMTVLEPFCLNTLITKEQTEKRSGNKTRLTPHRKSWREELKGKHSYGSGRRKCDLLQKAGELQRGFLLCAYTSANFRGTKP